MSEFDEDGRFVVSVRQAFATITFRHCNHRLRRRIQTLDFSPLTDVPILAVGAGPIASCGCDGKDLGSGHVVGNRFLFDRVDVAGYDLTVDIELQLPSLIAPNATETNLAFSNVTEPGTSRASDSAVRQWLVKGRFLTYIQCLSSLGVARRVFEPIDAFSHLIFIRPRNKRIFELYSCSYEAFTVTQLIVQTVSTIYGNDYLLEGGAGHRRNRPKDSVSSDYRTAVRCTWLRPTMRL